MSLLTKSEHIFAIPAQFHNHLKDEQLALITPEHVHKLMTVASINSMPEQLLVHLSENQIPFVRNERLINESVWEKRAHFTPLQLHWVMNNSQDLWPSLQAEITKEQAEKNLFR